MGVVGGGHPPPPLVVPPGPPPPEVVDDPDKVARVAVDPMVFVRGASVSGRLGMWGSGRLCSSSENKYPIIINCEDIEESNDYINDMIPF